MSRSIELLRGSPIEQCCICKTLYFGGGGGRKNVALFKNFQDSLALYSDKGTVKVEEIECSEAAALHRGGGNFDFLL
jgi:hypothetical protein